ncbi:MAG: hypothetical protein KDB01_17640 [Planctomycetaceae bacterium]|nr:hypothetical protein [Planctomycetaceae bacterium]
MPSLTDSNRPLVSPLAGAAEQALQHCIEEQSSVFGNAVHFLESLEKAASHQHRGDPDSVAKLQRTLERVVTAQQKVSQAHARFTALQITASVALRSSLKSHEETLRSLVARINSLLDIFKTMRNELSPEMDSDIKRRSMHSAYQKSLKSV